MSKYAKLSSAQGHSKFFLQRTIKEHDRSMDAAWMQMVYRQSFTVMQYAAWLARMHATFDGLEKAVQREYPERRELLEPLLDAKLLRTAALEGDLKQLVGSSWRDFLAEAVCTSPATELYLKHLQEDSSDVRLLIAHHFLQYNAVLSGGAYLGKMLCEKLCLPHGAPGALFYAFEDILPGKEPARVQKYLSTFDRIDMSDGDRERMLLAMRRVYEDTEAMMTECYKLNPGETSTYAAALQGGATEPPEECEVQVELTLAELHRHDGADGVGRILISINRELLDVSAGRDIYGPGCGYSILAARDVTRCLATMSLDLELLDDLTWKPIEDSDQDTMTQWREKLGARYPLAGYLKPTDEEISSGSTMFSEGLRKRGASAPIAPAKTNTSEATPSAGSTAADQVCPMTGKVGVPCPMAMFGINVKRPEGASAPTAAAATAPQTAVEKKFMSGKSLTGIVSKQGEPTVRYEDTWFYILCPLHWDWRTTKLVAVVAALAWLHGAFMGWLLRRQLVA